MDTARQRELILDQFSKQAIPFSKVPAHSSDDTNRLIIETAGIGADDTVLDVACGPGLVACAVAEVARHVTGIDITPAMIEQAQERQRASGLTNMTWELGDVPPLPFSDSSFSAVITRFSFHHLLDPRAVLAEMVRVCQPGGKVCVVDVFTSSPEQAEAYDQLERLRDPSHARGFAVEELTGMLWDAGVRDIGTAFYGAEREVEEWFSTSFPDPGDVDAIRRLFEDDLGVNRMGLGVVERDGAIHFAYPVVILAGVKT